MGFWNWLTEVEEKNEYIEESRANGSALGSIFTGESVTINEKKDILKIPIALYCHNIIVGSVSSLPINLYKHEDGGTIEVSDDYRIELLNKKANIMMTGRDFKESVVSDLLLYGNSYTVIERNGNTITELWPLNPKEVTISKYIKKGYRVENVKFSLNNYSESKNQGTFDLDEILVVARNSDRDGLSGVGVIELGDDVFKLAMSELNLANTVFEKGSMPGGILTIPNKLSQDAFTRLKNSWSNMYGNGSSNAGKVVILENEAKYEKLSYSPNELGLSSSRDKTSEEIAKLFNVPFALVDSKGNTYGSVEAMSLLFLQNAIEPLLTTIEESLNRSLLLESEKEDGYFFEFDVRYFNRSTESEQISSLDKALKGGIISINEARERLNLPKLERDAFKMSLGDVFMYTDDNSIFIPNMNVNTADDKGVVDNGIDN